MDEFQKHNMNIEWNKRTLQKDMYAIVPCIQTI